MKSIRTVPAGVLVAGLLGLLLAAVLPACRSRMRRPCSFSGVYRSEAPPAPGLAPATPTPPAAVWRPVTPAARAEGEAVSATPVAMHLISPDDELAEPVRLRYHDLRDLAARPAFAEPFAHWLGTWPPGAGPVVQNQILIARGTPRALALVDGWLQAWRQGGSPEGPVLLLRPDPPRPTAVVQIHAIADLVAAAMPHEVVLHADGSRGRVLHVAQGERLTAAALADALLDGVRPGDGPDATVIQVQGETTLVVRGVPSFQQHVAACLDRLRRQVSQAFEPRIEVEQDTVIDLGDAPALLDGADDGSVVLRIYDIGDLVGDTLPSTMDLPLAPPALQRFEAGTTLTADTLREALATQHLGPDLEGASILVRDATPTAGATLVVAGPRTLHRAVGEHLMLLRSHYVKQLGFVGAADDR